METFTILVTESNTYAIIVDAKSADDAVDIGKNLVRNDWDYVTQFWHDGSCDVEVM